MKTILQVTTCLLSLSFGLGTSCLRKSIRPESSEGYIHNPGYPYNLHEGNTCIMWIYVVDEFTKVVIVIEDLDILSPDNCRGNTSNRLVIGPHNEQQYCGTVDKDSRYEAYVSDFFYILYIINEESIHRGRGFMLHYEIMSATSTPSPSTKSPSKSITTWALRTTTTKRATARTDNDMWHDRCLFPLTSPSGLITVTRDVLHCGNATWLLYFPSSYGRQDEKSVKYILKFERLHLFRDCCSLDIYQGMNEYGHLVSHYFNVSFSHPHYIGVHGSQVFLKFTFKNRRYFGNFTIQFNRDLCPYGYSACSYNESRCYPTKKRCDGVWDCPLKGGDERGCSTVCFQYQFQCGNGSNYCYHENERCDGKGSCANYRDEQNCTSDLCSSNKGLFLCKNKRCIYEKWRCDLTKDCEDGSDEHNCNKLSSPRIIMACVVGTVVSSLLIVLALSFVFRVYAFRIRQCHGGGGEAHPVRHDSPLARLEQELLRRRAPPPQYNEAMLTSRSYDEVSRELGSQGQVDTVTNESTAQDGAYSDLSSGTVPGSGRSSRRNRRRRRHLHRNLQLQQLQQHQQSPHHPLHFFTEQPPSYLAVVSSENLINDLQLTTVSDDTHELQTLPIPNLPTDPPLPPYSLHDDLTSSTESDEDDEDDDDNDEDDFDERTDENCRLLGVNAEGEEEGDTCLSIGLPSETEYPNLLSIIVPQSTSLMMPAELEQVAEDLTKDDDDNEDDDDDKKEIGAEKEEGDNSHTAPSTSKDESDERVVAADSSVRGVASTVESVAVLYDRDDDCECILSAEAGEEEMYGVESDDTSDTACLIAS